jgi:hypothetical protein
MLCSGKLAEPAMLVQPCTEGLELRDAEQANKLVAVPIKFSDLIGVDSEPICLFADSTTSARQVGKLVYMATSLPCSLGGRARAAYITYHIVIINSSPRSFKSLISEK